jgi:hypothetical protein
MKKFLSNKFHGVWFEIFSFLGMIAFFLYWAGVFLLEYWRLQ